MEISQYPTSEEYTREYTQDTLTPTSATNSTYMSYTEPLNVSSSSSPVELNKSQKTNQQSQQQLQQQSQKLNQQSHQAQQRNNINNVNETQTVVLREKLVHAFRLNRKKQMTLDRINKYNGKLMEELKIPRVKASNCALMVINYTEQTEDPLIPEIWGNKRKNQFKQGSSSNNNNKSMNLVNGNNTQINGQITGNNSNDGCCVIM